MKKISTEERKRAFTTLADAGMEPTRSYNASSTNAAPEMTFNSLSGSPSSDNSLTSLAITQGLASSKTATPALFDVNTLANTDHIFGSPTAAQIAAASPSISNNIDEMDYAHDISSPLLNNSKDFVKTFSTLPDIDFTSSSLASARTEAASSLYATTMDQNVNANNDASSVPTTSKDFTMTSSTLPNTARTSTSLAGAQMEAASSVNVNATHRIDDLDPLPPVTLGAFPSTNAINSHDIDDVNGLPIPAQIGAASSTNTMNTDEIDDTNVLITVAQVGAASSSSAINTNDTVNAKHVALSAPNAATALSNYTLPNVDRTATSPTTAQLGAASSSTATNTNETDDADDVALSVPIDPKDFAKTFGDAPYRTIKTLSIQLKLRRNPPTPLTPEQNKDLKFMLRVLSSIESLTPALEKELHLRQSLEVVMGDHEQCQSERHGWRFPDDCIAIALTAHQKYASENWGANDDLQDDTTATADANAGPAAAANPPGPTNNNTNTTRTVRALNGLTLTVVRRPRADHPIYGANGIMRGIIIDTSGKAKSYKIDDQYVTTPYKVFGHNGLVVGQWWPMQICALRDGAHGMRMAGIAGSQTTGVHSIVVSGERLPFLPYPPPYLPLSPPHPSPFRTDVTYSRPIRRPRHRLQHHPPLLRPPIPHQHHLASRPLPRRQSPPNLPPHRPSRPRPPRRRRQPPSLPRRRHSLRRPLCRCQ